MRLSRRAFCGTALAATLWPRGSLGEETQERHVPWLDEVQHRPAMRAQDAPKLSPLLVDAQGAAIDSREAWEKRRGELRQWWREFLGMPESKPLERPEVKVVEEDRRDGAIRQLVRYETRLGNTVEAYLIRPIKADTRSPGVVVHHSTVDHTIRQPAGLEGAIEKAFGLKLAREGCVTLSPRNFLWPGEGKIRAHEEAEKWIMQRPGAKGMARMLLDSLSAVDVLASLPDVDPRRLGVVGHSLGAKEALYLAAFDDRIGVAVSSEGGVGTKFSNWNAPWYLGPAIDDPAFTREHHELVGLAAPRAFLLIGGESADGDRSWPFIRQAMRVYRLYEGRPRIGLYNHRQGHAVPAEAERKVYEWMTTYL
jgi:dienelactone hydrolase